MYFDYEGEINDYKSKIYDALKNLADRDMTLDAMAYAIDRRLSKVHPKYLKRIDLGPIHNVFAKDENELTHTVLESIGKKEIPLESYAISLKIDEVKSKGEFEEGNFFNKQTLQKWGDVEQQNYVLAPHRVIQLFYNKIPEIINNLSKPPIEISSIE